MIHCAMVIVQICNYYFEENVLNIISIIKHIYFSIFLGGVRHSRVPLSPDIKEALEVAYISRIMSKNFRKEGQPEKERIARITGLELDKVHISSAIIIMELCLCHYMT